MNYLIINMNVLLFFMNVLMNIYEPSNIKYDDLNNFYVVATKHPEKREQ